MGCSETCVTDCVTVQTVMMSNFVNMFQIVIISHFSYNDGV